MSMSSLVPVKYVEMISSLMISFRGWITVKMKIRVWVEGGKMWGKNHKKENKCRFKKKRILWCHPQSCYGGWGRQEFLVFFYIKLKTKLVLKTIKVFLAKRLK